jgi:nitrite reductase/ring-hydroxylating ferredoxin subunit
MSYKNEFRLYTGNCLEKLCESGLKCAVRHKMLSENVNFYPQQSHTDGM